MEDGGKYYCLKPKKQERNKVPVQELRINFGSNHSYNPPIQAWPECPTAESFYRQKKSTEENWRSRSFRNSREFKENVELSWRNQEFRDQNEGDSDWMSSILRRHHHQNAEKPMPGYLRPNKPDSKDAIATTSGTMYLCLNHQISVELSLENAIYIHNPESGCMASISADASCSAIAHFSGRMYQKGACVEIKTPSECQAKMCQKGITFRNTHSTISYLIDEGGVRTTMEKFSPLKAEMAKELFYAQTQHCKSQIGECWKCLQRAKYFENADGDAIWMINGLQITQSGEGDVVISSEIGGKRTVKTSLRKGNISILSSNVYACASMPPEAHVFVRCGNKRVHANRQDFNVRIGAKSAGLNEEGKLKMY